MRHLRCDREAVGQVFGDPGFFFLLGKHLTGLDGMVFFTKKLIVSNTPSHGVDVISMWLTEYIPVCSLKTRPQGFFSFL